MVLHDFSKAKVSAFEVNANFVYMRFHGPTGNYRESYSDHVLDDKAEMIAHSYSPGKMFMPILITLQVMLFRMQGIYKPWSTLSKFKSRGRASLNAHFCGARTCVKPQAKTPQVF
jgi:uncharacterized protein YecE (DUF72 family)